MKQKNECICGSNENSAKIFECLRLTKEEPKIEFKQIYSKNVGKI